MAIENNLPEVLPSTMRIRVRDVKRKTMERDLLLRYVQKQIWKVGGIGLNDDAPLNPDIVEVNAGIDLTNSDTSISDSVQMFTEKIRMLEQVAKTGEIPNVDNGGGIWLNGLKSRQVIDNNDISIDINADNNNTPSFEPIEGYEERIKVLIEKDIDQIDKDQQALISVSPVKDMLLFNRGFQLKELENTELKSKKKFEEVKNKIVMMKNKIN
jgi:hypothetical protein